jgi:hypothetical protein
LSSNISSRTILVPRHLQKMLLLSTLLLGILHQSLAQSTINPFAAATTDLSATTGICNDEKYVILSYLPSPLLIPQTPKLTPQPNPVAFSHVYPKQQSAREPYLQACLPAVARTLERSSSTLPLTPLPFVLLLTIALTVATQHTALHNSLKMKW